MWPGVDQIRSSVGFVSRTRFEQLLIAKMFMKTALDQEDLAKIWGTSRELISKILLKWCPRWGDNARLHVRLQHLPRHFLEVCTHVIVSSELDSCRMCVCVPPQKSQPEGYSTRYHTLPSTEVDGKDIRMETIRKDNIGKRLSHSTKYKMSYGTFDLFPYQCG